MYIYLITNLINNKKYVGQTSDFTRRMYQHKHSSTQLIDQKIQQYGENNFSFEIIDTAPNRDELNELEKYYILEYNTLIPYGYNIHTGGLNNSIGEENSRAMLTTKEAQWILDNRNIRQKELYNICPFKDKITYSQFQRVYNGTAWKHLSTDTKMANNLARLGEECGNAIYTNQEVYDIRENYAKGVYYKDAWEISGCKMTLQSFYNLYNGRGYTNVHYDVYTEENRKKHKPDHSGENNGRAKLTKDDVLRIRELSKTMNMSDIYKLYPQVTSTSIRNIINRRTWKNV